MISQHELFNPAAQLGVEGVTESDQVELRAHLVGRDW
jgi:hypothetical protein